MHGLPLVSRVNKQALLPFELVNLDIWGSCPIVSKTGFRYFITFVNDHSRMTWLYLMKSRSQLFSIFCAFGVEIKMQFNVCVQFSQ